jgi:hypothetical protein
MASGIDRKDHPQGMASHLCLEVSALLTLTFNRDSLPLKPYRAHRAIIDRESLEHPLGQFPKQGCYVELSMNIYFMGVNTDAGGWYIGPDGKIHRVPGWDPEAMADLSRAINVIREAAQIKTPGVADAAIKSVMTFVQKEFSANVKEGGVIVIG